MEKEFTCKVVLCEADMANALRNIVKHLQSVVLEDSVRNELLCYTQGAALLEALDTYNKITGEKNGNNSNL